MSMAPDAMGVTFIIPDGVDPVGVYDDEDGILVFETDSPYLLSDGSTMQYPIPIFYPGTLTYRDKAGNLSESIAVSFAEPPDNSGITWDESTPWDSNTYWS